MGALATLIRVAPRIDPDATKLRAGKRVLRRVERRGFIVRKVIIKKERKKIKKKKGVKETFHDFSKCP
jgi:hypothetical protein